jgi:PAS domain S-box-containing protein
MLFAADEHMHLRDASEQACRVLGYSRAELLSLRVPDLLREDGDVRGRFAAYLAAGEQRGRATLKRKDGTAVDAGYHALVMQIGGESYYVCLVVPDVTASVSAGDAVSHTAAFD